MNKDVIIFKYALTAYSGFLKIKKNQNSRINETEFFHTFQSALIQNYLFINNQAPSNELCLLFLNQGRSLCELEALTFMPDENISLYKSVKENIRDNIQKITHILSVNGYEDIQYFTENDWRKFISILVAFKEWTEDIKFFENNGHDKMKLLMESPLISLCHL